MLLQRLDEIEPLRYRRTRVCSLVRGVPSAPCPVSGARYPSPPPTATRSRSVDVRSIEEHCLDDPTPVSFIAVPQTFSRALLAGVLPPRQGLLEQDG